MVGYGDGCLGVTAGLDVLNPVVLDGMLPYVPAVRNPWAVEVLEALAGVANGGTLPVGLADEVDGFEVLAEFKALANSGAT